MKLNERMKRRLAVLGCVVVGVVLIAAIGSQFRGETQGGNQTEEQTKQTEAVTVAVMPAQTYRSEDRTRYGTFRDRDNGASSGSAGTDGPDGTGRAAGSSKTNCSA